ncbi:DNA-directed RNA polymerase, alpha subunit [Hydrogenobacter thermophilus TK-6]|uniref:DNA-directed RNA polymerase subunit alpha n=1 Tax=Hydrogenobacter thermophilus (strain DSM 6534 / IAM 12695 / TK-6) TaxID=608538 RepID=D3DH88_HYDTT|nr:DNA-directed RNA polymerase subunit alpha [Hydrogenobacter thermophilus]ADO45128.1 DNA-directed RNA polymerase, alpha subunit [Hydrogenobacter thermophilus TK-6]BAI69190.1 DNA-directed RNA polymerase alpha subunit [Hydrogenobacter thermophilus TK-6]
MQREFLFPSKVYWEERGKTYGRFVVEPLERGFGITLGNSLRRTLLSSIQGTAITAVKIYGIYHEFSPIEGVQEDVLEVIANLKKIRFNLKSSDVETLYLKKKGEGTVTAKDITCPPNVDIINPDQKIATITDPNKELNMEIRIERGFGYMTTEEMEVIGEVGWILVDADFSPVRQVSFRVEKTRVEKRSDYDRLIMEIYTNGTKTPEEVVKEAISILVKYFSSLEHISYELPVVEEPVIVDEFAEKLSLPVEELDVSQRALNSIKRMGINTIGDLVRLSEEDLKGTKNVGRKAINEIKEALKQMGLYLGMDIESRR